jgi:hypothetical protein
MEELVSLLRSQEDRRGFEPDRELVCDPRLEQVQPGYRDRSSRGGGRLRLRGPQVLSQRVQGERQRVLEERTNSTILYHIKRSKEIRPTD